MATSKRRTFTPTNLKLWRLDRGLTQEKLSERLGMSIGNLSQLERGIIGYTQETLEGSAQALGISPADILVRDPRDPEGIWSIWDTLPRVGRVRAIEILKALRRTA